MIFPASHSAKPQLPFMSPSCSQTQYQLGDSYYQVQLPVWSTTLAASRTQLLCADSQKTLPRFHLHNAGLFFITATSVIPGKQRFHFYSSGIWLITADLHPQLTRTTDSSYKMTHDQTESSNIPMEYQKPGFHLLRISTFSFSKIPANSSWLSTQWLFLHKVPNSFRSPSPYNMAKSVTPIPHNPGTSLSTSGFLLLWWNAMTQKQVGEKRVHLAYTSISQSIIEGNQDRNSHGAGTWKQKPIQRPWRRMLTGLLPIAWSACFLIEPRTTSPGMAPPTMGWALPHQSVIKKMPSSLAYNPILWRHFLIWGFLLSVDPRLYQVDINLSSSLGKCGTPSAVPTLESASTGFPRSCWYRSALGLIERSCHNE
jgi:hypothetical protein